VAVSDTVARRLRGDLRLPARSVTVIPNGIRPSPAAPSTLRAELRLAPDQRIALAVGNLYPVKGHEYLITALAGREPGLANVHAVIAGRGHAHDALVRHAEALGVASRVHLLGYRGDIPNLLGGADVFVLPSLAEGMPLALLEAMFAGRPVVATDVGEVAAVLEGRAGMVVPPANPVALGAAIARVLNDAAGARRMGDRARVRAWSEYHLDRTVERYAALYARQLVPVPGS
jgi:glycosyltransferase involved in cell wall biosynthesis